MFTAYLLAMSELFTPPASQLSVNRAIEMYNIQVPENVTEIVYNPEFPTNLYGQANLNLFGRACRVQIGPSAFQSWSILGSVLAHEVEAHCNEPYSELIPVVLGLKSSNDIERRAYKLQLTDENIKRFHNTLEEVQFFEMLWRMKYPED